MIQSCPFQGEDHGGNKLYCFSGSWTHHQDKATIHRIMLKFRPIAPKPAIHGSTSGNTANDTSFLSKRRTKRKYVRSNKTNNSNNSKMIGSTRGRKSKAPAKAAPEENRTDHLQFSEFTTPSKDSFDLGLGLGCPDRVVVESWVVVKGVTVSGIGGGLLGCTDGERMRTLEADTCPGFVSDGVHTVQWVNLSYKMMVDGGGETAAEMAVRLVVNEDIPVGCSAFACTVRVVYWWRKEKYSKTMPCDVWRMDFGGFAWRLDAKAALCLGR